MLVCQWQNFGTNDGSGSSGSLAVSQFRLLLRVRYAAFGGRTALAELAFRLRLSRRPKIKITPTATPNIANGITKPIAYPSSNRIPPITRKTPAITVTAKAIIVSGFKSPWANTASKGTNTMSKTPISRRASPDNSEMLRNYFPSDILHCSGESAKDAFSNGLLFYTIVNLGNILTRSQLADPCGCIRRHFNCQTLGRFRSKSSQFGSLD